MSEVERATKLLIPVVVVMEEWRWGGAEVLLEVNTGGGSD